MNSIKCINISKSFQIKDQTLDVLNSINLEINESDTIAISGKSGSGKSTLLHILAGLDKPSSGEIIFNQKNLNNMSKSELARTRLLNFGFVYQFHHLLEDLTVEENILVPGILNKENNNLLLTRTKNIMKKLDIFKRKDHLPWKLSGGEKQRTAIARALINNPKFIFLDEPTGNLDDENAKIIQELLMEMRLEFGVALIAATHDQSFIKCFDSVYKISQTNISEVNE